MGIVGNDVVDLRAPAIAQHHLRPRFIQRVLCESEQAGLALAEEPKRMLWALFAAKEAAYKVAVKLGMNPGFEHRNFEVSPEFDSVQYRDLRMHLRMSGGPEAVHAITATTTETVLFAAAAATGSMDNSAAARSLLCTTVGAVLQCDAGELEVVREPTPGSWDGFAPPRLLQRGAPIDADVSLSHDGRFIGFAAYLLAVAIDGSVNVRFIPGHGMLDSAWLGINGLLALVLGRFSLPRR